MAKGKASEGGVTVGAATSPACIQVLGVDADTGTSVPSALLCFEGRSYLFNAGEGFQHFCGEHKLKMNRITDIMLTRTTAEASGGLPGMLLTMAMLNGHTGTRVIGPPGLSKLADAFRTFLFEMELHFKELGAAWDDVAAQGSTPTTGSDARPETQLAGLPPAVANEMVTIWPVLLEAAVGNAAETSGGGGGDRAATGSEQGCCSGAELAAACYVCRLPDSPGKFMAQKATALGVPPGPAFGKLTRGEEVVVADGRTVKPSDVVEPAVPGPLVLVVDCPSTSFLPSLLSAPQLRACAEDERLACIVHLGPCEVVELPAYQAWLATFPRACCHILASQMIALGIPVRRRAAELQAQLNLIDPGLFRLHSAFGAAESGVVERATNFMKESERCTPGATNQLRYHLRPLARRGLDAEDCPGLLDAASVQQELRETRPEVLEAAATARAAGGVATQPVPACVDSAGREELEVTFLGTGSAVPSKYRNVTGLHINLFARGGLLLDPGECSYAQMRRRFGAAGADALIARLSCIWISHLHADHHPGLPSILAARTRMLGPTTAPLLVFGPPPLRQALQAHALLQHMRFLFVEASALCATSASSLEPDVTAAVDAVRGSMGLRRFESVPVSHCPDAHALVLESAATGWKLVFSGDTGPCEALVEAAKGATLLIHEATFDDSLEAEARAKQHSTTCDAVAAGAAAGAYRTLLTHFSSRYPKIPVVGRSFQDSVGIAFDLMSVNLADLPRLPALVPALQLLFKEGEDEGDVQS